MAAVARAALCLLFGLASAVGGQDDSSALMQHGLHVQQLPGANMDLPDWMKNLVSAGVEDEDTPELEEEITPEQQKALDDEAEHGEDFYINYTALEEADAMEGVANSTAPMLKWLFMDTAFYNGDREFTNSHIMNEWHYGGRPGRFTINSNPQGELIYHTPFKPDHEAIGILLPIADGPWQLQATVRDGDQNPLSLVRVKAMTNATNLVVSFADINGTNWSRDVLASKVQPLEKMFERKLDVVEWKEKPEQEQDKLPRDFSTIDLACFGPMKFTPACIKKHGLPKKAAVKKAAVNYKTELFSMVRGLLHGSGMAPDMVDRVQALLEVLFGKGPEQEGLIKDLMQQMKGMDANQMGEVMTTVLTTVGEVLGPDFDLTKVMGKLMGGAGGAGGADFMGMMQGLFGKPGEAGDLMGALSGLLGGKKPEDLLAMAQGLLGGKPGADGAKPVDFMGMMQGMQGLLGGGKAGEGVDLAAIAKGFLDGTKKGGAGGDLASIMQGFMGGNKKGGGVDYLAIAKGIVGSLPKGNNGGNKSLAEHVVGLFDPNDEDAVEGERPVEALHRKFKALRHDLGIGASKSGEPKKGIVRSIKDGFTELKTSFEGTAYADAGSSDAGSEELKEQVLYKGCHYKHAKDIAEYSKANRTAQGLQMWWPYEMNEKALDYGWLVDAWTNTAGVNVGSPFPEDGLITGWEWYGSGTHVKLAGARVSTEPIYFQVLRWVGGITGKKFKVVSSTMANSTVLRAFNSLSLAPKDHIQVKKGDFLGFYCPQMVAIGYTMAPMCEMQVMFMTSQTSSQMEVGSSADYLFGGDKNSPRAYHYHAQYVQTPKSSARTELMRG